MAEIQTDVLRLTPYIEPEDNATDADRFIAGFRDEHGDTWDMKVPVGRSVLERLILGSTELSPYLDSQGRIQPFSHKTSVTCEKRRLPGALSFSKRPTF